MTDRNLRLLVAATAVLLALGVASAADQLISGKKLLIKNPPSGAAQNKVVHMAKDPSITIASPGFGGDPQCSGAGGGGASSIRIIASGGAGDVTIPLPCAGWTTNGSNTLFKYKDSSGTTCNIVLVKGGTLAKAVCKGAHVAIDLNGSMSPVAVVTTLNTERYCTEFGGIVAKDGSDDKTFLRKDASAPASCPTTTTTLPSATCCGSASNASCFDIGNQSDADFCVSTEGTGASGVCDGATGTCQPTYGGESKCCRDAPGIPCVEGPDVDESLCVNFGGVFAQDSCADGCIPSTSTSSSTTSTSSTSTIPTTSTSNTSSTSTTTSSSTSTSYPPCSTTGDPCGTVGAGCVCLIHCPTADCGESSLECAKPVGGSCNTDPICFGFAGPSSFCVGNACNPSGPTCNFNFAAPGNCAIPCP